MRRDLALVLGLALVLRLLRVPARWCANTWLYSAYPADTVELLRAGELGQALTTFTGLHPPGWPLLHAASELFAPIPLLWLLLSVLCSFGAVVLIARRDALAGLLLATSPVQLAYAAEVNDYPLSVLVVAALLAGGPRLRLVATLLAPWTHALAALAAALVALTLPRRRAALHLGLLALSALPLLPGGLALLADPGSATQPPFKAGLVFHDVLDRFGLLWLGLLPAVLVGAQRARWLLLPLLGLVAALLALTAAGIAAPHQFPYWLFVGLPLALLAGHGARGSRPLTGLTAAVALTHGILAGWAGLQQLVALERDPTRAVDAALAELDRPWSCREEPSRDCSGDALYLLVPRTVDDDDKRRLTPSLWRLAPWRAMPAVRPYADLDWGDYRHGQPRLVDGHVIYLEDHVRQPLLQARAAHARLWLVVEEAHLDGRVARALAELIGEEPLVVGPDLLWRP